MDRNKLLAIVIGGIAALGAVAFLSGNAQAASWHDYSGDIYPGHAYGLVVPVNARSYEITLAGDDAATARVSVFGPDGAKLGFYALSHDLPTAAVVQPSEGRHVIYVYDLADGAGLKLRVDSEAAPPADLQKIDLARKDTQIGESSSPQKFDKVFTTKLDREPVFATLLYEGSASGLDATVASTKGDVVAVKGESGSAFSPGVWSSQKGERTSTPENLAGNAYTVTVHAQKFEGTMVLTTLGLDIKAPAPSPAPFFPPPPQPGGKPPAQHPAPAKAPALPADSIVVPVGKPTAFVAQKGALTLSDLKTASARENGSSYVHDTISIYAPDDTLVKFVTLDGQHPTLSVDLPTSGEYVAFVQTSSGKGVLAYAKENALSGVRELQVRKESFVFQMSGLHDQAGHAFALEHAPVALQLRIPAEDLALLASVEISNAHGTVAYADSVAQVPGLDLVTWSSQDPAHFAAGEHRLTLSGTLEGKITLAALSYVRDATAPAAAPAKPAAPEKAHDDGLFGLGGLISDLP